MDPRILSQLLPALTTATTQGKLYWRLTGQGYGLQLLTWSMYLSRELDLVTILINDDTGRLIMNATVDDNRAVNLHDAITASTIEPDEASLTQFIGYLSVL